MEKISVKILGISCGHRKGMNTAWLVRCALKAAEKFGRRVSQIAEVQTEFVDLADKEIKPCRSYCQERHMPNRGLPYAGTERVLQILGCSIKDDYMATELMPKMREADAFVLGSPVFSLSYTSRFRLFTERLSPLLYAGCLTNKPVAVVTVGEIRVAGQETCLEDMNRILRSREMVSVSWYMGGLGVSGPPFGPAPSDADYNRVIGVKKDRFAQWLTVANGKRVAELAVMLKVAKRKLEELYTREFTQVYCPPHGEEGWAWYHLDKEDEEFLASLSPGECPESTRIKLEKSRVQR